MWRAGNRSLGLRWRAALASVVACAGIAWGQDEAPPTGAEPASAIERYLEERELTELLAVYLLERLKASEGQAKIKLADRLGSLYTALLDRATTRAQREEWEKRSEELLAGVPEADSFELRLNLAKARYLRAEELAERARLRLVSPEERQESERTLRTVGAVFADIGAKLARRVDFLERRESTGPEQDVPALREQLAEARRLRSLAMYYAGWSGYYMGFLSNKAQPAEEALTSFGYLLNTPGREANVERVPEGLLTYEHVARAAIGCALAESLRGRDGPAILWLETLDRTEGIPEGVRKQLFARRMWVLGSGKRWADLEFAIARRRQPTREVPVNPLEVGEARLLAVIALEALQDANTPERARGIIQPLADTAMTDLITLGEVKHVQDLVLRYGSATLGGDGFIVQYVRGMQAYERAREAHQTAGGDPEQPSESDAVVNLYRTAAGSFGLALKSEDSARFEEERANAGLLLGLSHFYAGELVPAADLFEEAYRRGGDAKAQEDALWLAIVSLDKAAVGKPSVRGRLQELSTLYLKEYPTSERAAKLLLRQASSGLISEDEAIKILLGIAAESPLYEAARRQAATLLYNVYRRARGTDRDFAALRFAEVSEEILRIDRGKLGHLEGDEARRVMEQIIIRVRQVLDAVLGMSAPDLARADKAFEVLDAIAAEAGVDFQKVEDELTYRRLQLSLARGDRDQIIRSLDRLRGIGGRFADAADRLMYKRAAALLAAAPDSVEAAAEVVGHGLRVIDQFADDANGLSDPAVVSLYNAVAEAASRVWASRKDEFMRETALRLDRAIVEQGNPPAVVLRRLAEHAEAVGEAGEALDAWRLLVSGLGRGDPAWFEARYHSLRLLARSDLASARQAMAQHKVLNPEFGPDPWGEMLRDLDARMGPTPAEPEAMPGTGGPR